MSRLRVERRLAEYDERTAPLVDYYRGRSRFYRIDGFRPPDAVFQELTEIATAGTLGRRAPA